MSVNFLTDVITLVAISLDLFLNRIISEAFVIKFNFNCIGKAIDLNFIKKQIQIKLL